MYCTQGIIGEQFDDPVIVEEAMDMLKRILHVTEVELKSLSGTCKALKTPEERAEHFLFWCKQHDIHTRATMPGLLEQKPQREMEKRIQNMEGAAI